MKRIAFYGGSFDPPHRGHLAIADALVDRFGLDAFVFIPAFHAPHKARLKPTSAYDRYTMLCLATQNSANITVSQFEIEMPERPYSVETLSRILEQMPDDEIYFVIGADSWRDILTWREWEKVMTMVNIIVVTRPGVEIGFDHVTDNIRERIVDLRNGEEEKRRRGERANPQSIFITDAVNMDISATEIRRKIREEDPTWHEDVTAEVANYVEKYQIYS
ncbi:MAG: nicotinate (nicotinamide) nucleotide adenylyltransferase [Chloracidobacterium sp.]|nr:nicotinate (nicotinamide) nucleotide adenylyltransferase [Chloracidobacterium sp.]